MSLGQALSTALSGLRTNQAALALVSSNVANAETPGYVKKTLIQTATTTADTGYLHEAHPGRFIPHSRTRDDEVLDVGCDNGVGGHPMLVIPTSRDGCRPGCRHVPEGLGDRCSGIERHDGGV